MLSSTTQGCRADDDDDDILLYVSSYIFYSET
jgi:hypothetical protein